MKQQLTVLSKQLWMTTCPLDEADTNCSPIQSKHGVVDDWPVWVSCYIYPHVFCICMYMINQTSRRLNKAKQINSTRLRKPFFLKKNWLPQVGFARHSAL